MFDHLAGGGEEVRILAGGTDLIVRLRSRRFRPQLVVDIKGVDALGGSIITRASQVRIPALTTMTDLIEDDRIQNQFPALAEAARVVGSVQIRNRATLAGNICNASPAADTAPSLLVYGAIVNLVGRDTSRSLGIDEFFEGPGRTAMKAGEIVESIDLPVDTRPRGAAFQRITRRRGVDLATVSVSCLVQSSGETLFACGAAAPRPILLRDQSGVLRDSTSSPIAQQEAIKRLMMAASPITDIRGGRDYRQAMLAVIGIRAFETACGRLQEAQGLTK